MRFVVRGKHLCRGVRIRNFPCEKFCNRDTFKATSRGNAEGSNEKKQNLKMSNKKVLKQARTALDAGDTEKALDFCNQVIENDDQNFHAFIFAGVAYSRKKDPDNANRSYERAVALRPDLPLAWKGIIDLAKQSPPDATDVKRRLRIVEAHQRIAELVPEKKNTSLLAVADGLDRLAHDTGDGDHVDRAVCAWEQVEELNVPTDENINEHIVLLLRITLPKPHISDLNSSGGEKNSKSEKGVTLNEAGSNNAHVERMRANALVGGRLDAALNHCEQSANPVIVSLLAERCQYKARKGLADPLETVEYLKKLGCVEEALALFEEDKFASLPSSLQWDIASGTAGSHTTQTTALHPHQSRVCVLLGSRENDTNTAQALAGVDSTAAGKRSVAQNLTVALVWAILYIKAGEYFEAIAVAKDGINMCKFVYYERTYKRMEASLFLLIGHAYKNVQKYAEAVDGFSQSISKDSKDSHYSHCGLIETYLLSAGRRSNEYQCAVVDAANQGILLGVVEKAWTAALRRESNSLEQMRAAVETCVAHATQVPETNLSEKWSTELIQRVLGIDKGSQRHAADAACRLGQLLLARDALDEAKASFMGAASLSPGYAIPFFFLGYVFECLAYYQGGKQGLKKTTYHDKLIIRAMRCYNKGLMHQAYHALGSRRLARLHASLGDKDAAVAVARAAVKVNLLATWAWNLIGWSQFGRHMSDEACRSFQSALRSTKASLACQLTEESLFGTYLGPKSRNDDERSSIFLEDTENNVAIDSWRGLALCYRDIGRFKSSLSGIEQALSLCENSSSKSSRTRQKSLLALDRANCLVCLGRPLEALSILREQHEVGPLSCRVNYLMGDAYLHHAEELWRAGTYRQATEYRELSSKSFSRSAECLIGSSAETKGQDVDGCRIERERFACFSLKHAGDAAFTAATYRPDLLSRVVGTKRCKKNMEAARRLYKRAKDLRGIDTNSRVICDIASSLLLSGNASAEDCSGVVESLLDSGASLTAIVSGLAPLRYKNAILFLLLHASEPKYGSLFSAAAKAALTQVLVEDGELGDASRWAKDALESDTSSFQGWLGIGRIRELNALMETETGTRSCKLSAAAAAYKEAVLLGGGLEACDGVARSLETRLMNDESCRSKSTIAEALTWHLRAGNKANEVLERMAHNIEGRDRDDGARRAESWNGPRSSLVDMVLTWPNVEGLNEKFDHFNSQASAVASIEE